MKMYKRNIYTNLICYPAYPHFFKDFCSIFNRMFMVAMMANYFSCKTNMASIRETYSMQNFFLL